MAVPIWPGVCFDVTGRPAPNAIYQVSDALNVIAALLTQTPAAEPRSAFATSLPSGEGDGNIFANLIAELGAENAAAGFVPDQAAAGAQDAAGKAQALANLLAQVLSGANGAQTPGTDGSAAADLSALGQIPDDVKAALLAAIAERSAKDAEEGDTPDTENSAAQSDLTDAPLAAALTVPATPVTAVPSSEGEPGIQTLAGTPQAQIQQDATPQHDAVTSGNGKGQDQAATAGAAAGAAEAANVAGGLAKGAAKAAGAAAPADKTGAEPSLPSDTAQAKGHGDKKPEATGLARAAEQANPQAKPQIEAAAARHALLSAQESQGKPTQSPDTTLLPPATPSTDAALGTRAAALAAAPHSGPALPVAALAMQIAAYARAGASRFEIRMDPPELGRVDVRLHVTQDGSVSTRMIVERPETLDLLMRDARALERALGDAGLKTDDGSLRFSLRGDGFAQNGQSGAQHDLDGHGARTQAELDDDIAPITAVQAAPHTSLTASNGLDIRV